MLLVVRVRFTEVYHANNRPVSVLQYSDLELHSFYSCRVPNGLDVIISKNNDSFDNLTKFTKLRSMNVFDKINYHIVNHWRDIFLLMIELFTM